MLEAVGTDLNRGSRNLFPQNSRGKQVTENGKLMDSWSPNRVSTAVSVLMPLGVLWYALPPHYSLGPGFVHGPPATGLLCGSPHLLVLHLWNGQQIKGNAFKYWKWTCLCQWTKKIVSSIKTCIKRITLTHRNPLTVVSLPGELTAVKTTSFIKFLAGKGLSTRGTNQQAENGDDCVLHIFDIMCIIVNFLIWCKTLCTLSYYVQ